MKVYSGLEYKGQKVYTWEYIEHLRQEDYKKRNPYKIIPQKGGQEKMLSYNADIQIVGGSRGGSKGQPYGSKVVTPFGFRNMGDLKVGSIITDVNGCMQKVIHITELGHRKVYRLNFSDGTSVDCTDDHLWKIKKTNTISKTRKINGTGQEADWKLWTMEQIMAYLDNPTVYKTRKGNSTCNLLIPLSEPVKFTKNINSWYKPKTDPYFIGVILGDGCVTESSMKSGGIRITTMDYELIENIAQTGYKPFRDYKRDGTDAKDYFYNDDSLVTDLMELELYGKSSTDKFIPEQYKFTTVQNRFKLVQGLMDTDGTVDSRGHCSYTTTSKTLANDLAFVLRSLGAYVTISKNKAGYKTSDGEYIECNDAYTLYIKIKDSERLFGLSRKKEKCKDYNGGVSIPTKRITGYEFVGYDKCRCIAVSNPTALYLTDDFNVTHNSFSLLLEGLKDYDNKNFRSVILRKEVDDLTDLIDTSNGIYGDFGTYNRSKADMTWNFHSGGALKFNYYSDSFEDFKIRYQGKQYAYIGIDEITHIEYPKFKYLITNNRNAFDIRNRFWGTCNPDPDSWVAKFIDWWIGEDGLPIPERNGVVRYCFMDGDEVNDIYWGDTKEEVYEQCKSIIDKYWLDSYAQYGSPADLFVKSVTFIEAKLADNIQLLRSDPTYLANLAGQSEEQRARDLEGNWKFKTVGDDLIKMHHMENFFNNAQQLGDGVRRVSLDAAFDGGDNLVMWLWEGWHLKDLFVCRRDSKDTVDVVKAKLKEWRVLEENFTYDLNGIGQVFKGFFKNAIPFNNRESVAPEDKGLYDTIKSQSAYLFAKKIINKEISIEPYLLDLRFNAGKNKSVHLRQILMDERKAIKANTQAWDKGFTLIKKADMKKLVGHSPDFIEAMLMRMIFEIKKKKGGRPKWNTRYINPQIMYR